MGVTPNLPTVRIAEADVQVVEYRGERVVTFKQIDKVHGRPDGTAKRNFHENRERFVEGADYVSAPYDALWSDEYRTAKGGNRKSIVLITRQGYFKLVKCLQDDLAWQIHGEMVEAYFASRQEPTHSPQAVASAIEPREIRLAMNQSLRLAKMAGLEGSHALHAASAQTFRITGHDTLKTMGIARLPAPEGEKPLIPTQIGERLGGLSAQAVNKLLQANGFQTKDERDDWSPTDKGRDAGAHFILANRQHAEGVAYQLVWHPRIIEILRPHLTADGNVLAFPA